MKKMVVFDLDGTLLDTIGDIQAAVNHALSQHGFQTVGRKEMMSFVGNGLANALRKSLAHVGGTVDEDEFKEMHGLLVSYYNSHPAVYTVPYPGIDDLLDSLEKEGVASAIFSNKKHELVETIARDILPSHSFSFVIGQSERYPLKPNPAAMLEALENLGVGLSDVVYVGDSEVDKSTAENAGVSYHIVNYGFRPKADLEAKGICGTLNDVKELKEKLLSEN